MENRSSNYSLPEDLLIEILSWLPVKSLLRFKCVCKSWYDLIKNNPSFVSKHLTNSNHHRLIIGHRFSPCISDNYTILSSSNNTDDVLPRGDFLHDFRLFDSSHQRLLGSYNGIVCLADELNKKVVFWNPAAKQFKVVRKSNIEKRFDAFTEHAFGYDFKTNDYKVMKFISESFTPRLAYNKVEVYSLNTDSWRKSDAIFLPKGFELAGECYKRPMACVNGFYSTMACTYSSDGAICECFMVTIDMSNEAFMLTPLPPGGAVDFDKYPRYWSGRALTEVNKSVAFIMSMEKNKSFVVFALNEYGPNGTWTKLYTIASVSDLFPVGFWRNRFFLHNSRGELVSCGARGSKIVRNIHGGYFQILEYKESLVCIKDFGSKIVRNIHCR